MNSNDVIVLYVLLKLFQIKEYDKHFSLIIVDTITAVGNRLKNYSAKSPKISSLWSHIGLYTMHIGYNTVCNSKTDIFKKISGVTYICPDSASFYVIM